MKDVLIETERFLLRTLTQDDVSKRYLGWINGANKSQYISYGNKQRSMDELRSYVTDRINDESVLFLGIFTRGSAEHLGNIKYESVNFQQNFAIMGILIGEEKFRGKGVAKEVITASSMWLNNTYGIQQIILGVDVGNMNAIKAYQKCGFRLEETPYIEAVAQNQTTMVWNLD